jgi:nitroimidazol reductase NimA-like FMN-containing flavoprotein (pyridoxamine 5'-phosphate oxidase superfamily)
MRRKDREMPEEFARMVADKCEWAVLSMVDPEGKPYCIPITIVREDQAIYFHSARDGFKVECLKNNGAVCLTCVGETCRIPDKFTTEYESAIIRGIAGEVLDEQEKIRALRLLCRRHTPTNMSNFDKAIAESLAHTLVWRIDIEMMTGKCKKPRE